MPRPQGKSRGISRSALLNASRRVRRASDGAGEHGCAGLVGRRLARARLGRMHAAAEQGGSGWVGTGQRSGGPYGRHGARTALPTGRDQASLSCTARYSEGCREEGARAPVGGLRSDVLRGLVHHRASGRADGLQSRGVVPHALAGGTGPPALPVHGPVGESASTPPRWCQGLAVRQAAGRPAGRETDLSRQLHSSRRLCFGTASAPEALGVGSLSRGTRCVGPSIRESGPTPHLSIGGTSQECCSNLRASGSGGWPTTFPHHHELAAAPCWRASGCRCQASIPRTAAGFRRLSVSGRAVSSRVNSKIRTRPDAVWPRVATIPAGSCAS